MQVNFSHVIGFAAGVASNDKKEDQQHTASIKNTRESIIYELRAKGTILPDYNWQDTVHNNKLEEMATAWFKRHPETKRGTGDFARKYPDKEKAFLTLEKMSATGRITPDEFIVLCAQVYDF